MRISPSQKGSMIIAFPLQETVSATVTNAAFGFLEGQRVQIKFQPHANVGDVVVIRRGLRYYIKRYTRDDDIIGVIE